MFFANLRLFDNFCNLRSRYDKKLEGLNLIELIASNLIKFIFKIEIKKKEGQINTMNKQFKIENSKI